MNDIYEFMKKLSVLKNIGEDIALSVAKTIEKMLSPSSAGEKDRKGAPAADENAVHAPGEEGRVYRDEPIPPRERSSEPKNRSKTALPPVSKAAVTEQERAAAAPQSGQRTQDPYLRLAAMRGIESKRSNRGKPPEEIFYLQAKCMEDFSDDFVFPVKQTQSGGKLPYQPLGQDYSRMSLVMLRRYFTWRTRVRLGQDEEPNTQFLFIYSAELVNLAGVDSPEAAYNTLEELRNRFSGKNELFMSCSRTWLRDIAVYYDLPAELAVRAEGNEQNTGIEALSDPLSADNEQLLNAADTSSVYKIKKSKLYERYPKELTEACCSVLRELASWGEAYVKEYAGVWTTSAYEPFRPLRFFDHVKKQNRVYRLNAHKRFRCKGRLWQIERISRTAENGRALGRLLKNVDARLRKKLGVCAALKTEPLEQAESDAVDRAVNAAAEKRFEAERPMIEPDLTKLETIRADADDTRDMLLAAQPDGTETDTPPEKTETEPDAAKGGGAEKPENTEKTEDAERDSAGTVFTPAEALLIKCLLAGEDYEAPLRALGELPSIAADGVNEKLMDMIGDTAIIEENGRLTIIEDYIDYMKGLTA